MRVDIGEKERLEETPTIKYSSAEVYCHTKECILRYRERKKYGAESCNTKCKYSGAN